MLLNTDYYSCLPLMYSKPRLKENGSSLFRSPEHINYRIMAKVTQISTWNHCKCSAPLACDVELENLWDYPNLRSQFHPSLEFCDTHQHPATCPIASRTTASWHKPLCFPIRTQPLEELQMLKGEWGCFHTIKINKKYILTKQASAQLAQIRYIAPPAYVIKSSQREWDSQVRK